MKPKVSVLIPAYNADQTIGKAINSIPDLKDVEVIVWSDGSDDNTFEVAQEALYDRKNPHICGISNENHGVAYATNRLLDRAQGEYVVLLGSDDWFLTTAFTKALKLLNGQYDLIYFDLQINDGTVMHLTPESKITYCGSTKFMRRAFVGDTRCQESKRAGEDWFFYQELLQKNPTELFTHKIIKHYNFPREGSLSWKQRNGLFTQEEL